MPMIVGKMRLVCELSGEATTVFDDPAVCRCRRTLAIFAEPIKLRMAVRSDTLATFMARAQAAGSQAMAMLYCLSYAFLLRVPS
jgi:hypothetical protein